MSIPEFYTKRLHLRPILFADNEDIFELFSDNEVLKYTDNRFHQTIEDSNHWIDLSQNGLDNKKHIFWGISFAHVSKLIGVVGIHHIDWNHRFGSLKYLLMKSFWNNGIMTESLRPIINFGFTVLELHRLEAQVYEKHFSSEKVLEKLHFISEGIIRENFYINSDFKNSKLFSLLNHEYQNYHIEFE